MDVVGELSGEKLFWRYLFKTFPVTLKIRPLRATGSSDLLSREALPSRMFYQLRSGVTMNGQRLYFPNDFILLSLNGVPTKYASFLKAYTGDLTSFGELLCLEILPLIEIGLLTNR